MTDSLSKLIEDELKALPLPKGLPTLYDPIAYTLDLGGKRLRPLLLMYASRLFGGSEKEAIHQALAVEIFHNFTLVHDDIMDNAPLRRGKPSVFNKWDMNTAILSGDVMYSLAIQELSKCPNQLLPAVLEVFVNMTIKVCEGQQMDMDFEKRSNVDLADYLKMIEYKTAYLLAGSLKIGALMSNASSEDANRMFEYGMKAGTAFQLMDDFLDAFGDPETFGKKVGGDIIEGKKTFLFIETKKALQGADYEDFTHAFSDDTIPEEKKLATIKYFFELSGSKIKLEQMAASLLKEAKQLLDDVQCNKQAKEALIVLTDKLTNRNK